MRIAHSHSDVASGGSSSAPSPVAVAAGVQPEEMNTAVLVQIVLGVAVVVVVLVVIVFQLMNLTVQTVESELAEGVGRDALAEVELAGAEKLTRYSVLDRQAGVFRIPIERAMTLMADETYRQPQEGYTAEVELLPTE